MLRNGTIVHCLWENKKTLEKSVFCEAWSPELTSELFPVPSFWSRGFVTHRKWNLMLLVHQNTGKENHYGKNYFDVLISTLGTFDQANKKKSVIYTLRKKNTSIDQFTTRRVVGSWHTFLCKKLTSSVFHIFMSLQLTDSYTTSHMYKIEQIEQWLKLFFLLGQNIWKVWHRYNCRKVLAIFKWTLRLVKSFLSRFSEYKWY